MNIEIKRYIYPQYVQAHKKSNYKHKESKEEIFIYMEMIIIIVKGVGWV